jgi:hypothetical protein
VRRYWGIRVQRTAPHAAPPSRWAVLRAFTTARRPIASARSSCRPARSRTGHARGSRTGGSGHGYSDRGHPDWPGCSCRPRGQGPAAQAPRVPPPQKGRRAGQAVVDGRSPSRIDGRDSKKESRVCLRPSCHPCAVAPPNEASSFVSPGDGSGLRDSRRTTGAKRGGWKSISFPPGTRPAMAFAAGEPCSVTLWLRGADSQRVCSNLLDQLPSLSNWSMAAVIRALACRPKTAWPERSRKMFL